MTKEVSGWRNREDDFTSSNHMIEAVLEACRSHDGWACPHCGQKDGVWDAELNNQEYHHLLHDSMGEPLERRCGSCNEKYFLRASMTVKYYTCADKEFGDG